MTIFKDIDVDGLIFSCSRVFVLVQDNVLLLFLFVRMPILMSFKASTNLNYILFI